MWDTKVVREGLKRRREQKEKEEKLKNQAENDIPQSTRSPSTDDTTTTPAAAIATTTKAKHTLQALPTWLVELRRRRKAEKDKQLADQNKVAGLQKTTL